MDNNLSSDHTEIEIDSSIESATGNDEIHQTETNKNQSESTSTAIDIHCHPENNTLDKYKTNVDSKQLKTIRTQHSSSESGDGKSTYEIISNDCNDERSSSSSTHTFPKLDLNNISQNSKICENDCDQERDTFSPLSNDSDRQKNFPEQNLVNNLNDNGENSNDLTPTTNDSNSSSSSSYAHEYNLPLSPITAATISGVAGLTIELDNKIIDKNTKLAKTNCLTSSSKEEKQRQNEEILQIMETSSISSETGSWESVFPHRSSNNSNLSTNNILIVNDAKDHCHKFLENERKISETPVKKTSNRNPSTSTACFIDASTLLDESEVNEFIRSDIILGPKLPDVPCCGPKSLSHKNSNISKTLLNTNIKPESSNTQETTWGQKMHLDKLESFHRSFEKCKVNKNDQQISQNCDSSSSCSSISPTRKHSTQNSATNQKISIETNNLSDEEKLLKRQVKTRADIKDQYNKESPTDPKISMQIFTSSSTEISSPENDASNKVRQDHERKQGNLVFQHNIQQFSTHRMEPHIPCTESSNLNDSTQTASLIWSDLDHHASINNSYTNDFDEAEPNNLPAKNNVILPETPHNSIVQIDESTSNQSKNSNSYQYYEIENLQNIDIPKKPTNRFDDLAPIVSGGASIKDFTPKQCESPPVTRKTDTCPIVSGGFISLDFQRDDEIELAKKNEKYKLKKKHTWIVDMSDCKPQRRQSSSSSSSNDNRDLIDRNSYGTRSSNSLGFYVSLNDIEPPKSLDCSNDVTQKKLSRSYHDNSFKQSTGFYVDLSENETSRNSTPSQKSSHTPPTIQNNNGSNNNINKKNIFSMFIDFGETKTMNTRKEPISLASRLSNSLLQQPKRQNSDDSMKNSLSSQETLMSNSNHGNIQFRHTEKLDSAGETMVGSSDESHKPSLQSIENVIESPRVQRRNIITKTENEKIKRHSWNISDQKNQNILHKRSSSLTNATSTGGSDYDKNIMSILDKIPLISKTSSMSIDSSLSPLDDISKSEFSTYSNNSVNSNSGFYIGIDDKQKKRRRDAKINETFDKSSQGSITDGILSKGISPSTDTDDITFQQDDNDIIIDTDQIAIQNKDRTIVMETIIETKETASPKKNLIQQNYANHQKQQQKQEPEQKQKQQHQQQPVQEQQQIITTSTNINKIHTMESLHATVEKQKLLLETVSENTETTNANNFVRLSDLDKPINLNKFELHSPDTLMSKSVGNQRHLSRLFTQQQQQRPHSWAMTRSIGNSIANITNSVDNLRSLSRLFPHLSKEFSNSLPNDVYSPEQQQNQQQQQQQNHHHHQQSLSKYQQLQHRSPIELDYINADDISNESSLASSISRMDESSISCRQPRRLGEDLLKMFLQEIGTDVIVEVNGRRIKAHKCILRSRCQYFAAMLAGGWVQSAGNVISLQGYSYSSVHFALCHIYSGACHPPDGISLMELAALADLLGLEGLKEVTAHALKSNYCHNFHKPCSGCIDGILQVLPVALNHALDDLYRKCLKWTCKYYLKIWPTRSFALLPSEIFSRCRQLVVAHLTSETVLESILDCDNLLAQLAHCRWAAVVENLVRDILDSAYGYISDHFASLIASDSFLSLGHDKSENITRLENILLRTASTLNSEQACRSYQRVTRLNTVLAAKIIKMPGNSDNTSNGIIEDHEEEMEWNEEFTRLVSSILSAVEQCLTRQCSRAMRVSSWQRMDLELRKKIQKLACLTEPLDIRSRNLNNQKSGTSIAKQISFNSNSRNQDLYQVKLAIQAHSKRALAQDTQLYKPQVKNYHQDRNTQTIEKGTQANHEINEGKILKSNSKSYLPSLLKMKQNPNGKILGSTSKYGHRRTYSEDSSVSTSKKLLDTSVGSTKSQQFDNDKITKTNSIQTKPIAQKLMDIKPRYLEPRKPRSAPLGPLKSQTLSNITNKGKHISSSDSSRTSSPATGRRILKNTDGKKSINMSLDSLASPSKRSNNKNNHNKSCLNTENEISIDSLANSMKSSIKTDKTISQESLVTNSSGGIGVGINKKLISRSIPGLINNINISHNKFNNIKTNNLTKNNNNMINKKNGISQLRPEQTLQIKSKKVNQQNHSTGSSPSSMATTTTNKSSRLSSVSSAAAVSSPRDSINKRPISLTPNSIKKHSFLSAKSREILAKKAEKIQQQQQMLNKSDSNDKPSIQIQIQGKLFTNKIKNLTNIPTRTQAPPNSLALKKKSLPAQYNTLSLPTKSSLLKTNSKNLKKIEQQQQHIEKSKLDKKINNNLNDTENEYRIETKLERSSTFCKESSDLPASELQIIE